MLRGPVGRAAGRDGLGRAALAVLDARRAAACRVPGPVVDLAELVDTAPDTVLAAGTTVVGVTVLARVDDPAAVLTRVAGLLPADGRLVLVEPRRRAGTAGRLQSRVAGAVRRATGLRPDLPVPALVRSAGLVIASIERFTMPTPVLPLRPFVAIEAIPTPEEVTR